MDFKENYLQFVKDKFGSHVVEALLSEDSMMPKYPFDPKNKQDAVREHLRVIAEKVKINPLLDNFKDKEWAFDFPGWVGELAANGNGPVREIMVIGMEPHIQNSNFQFTYGLVETSEGLFGELDKRLWERLHSIFRTENQPLRSHDFLQRFYITDLCHFAPKGNANQVNRPVWGKIREATASEFLLREIDLIQPRYIVSQGMVVADFVEKNILKANAKGIQWRPSAKMGHTEFLDLPENNYKYIPSLTRFQFESGRKIVHVALPHIGTNNTSAFWNKPGMVEALKKEISSF